MYSAFNSISYMGVSNSEIFLSKEGLESVEFNIAVTSTFEFSDESQISSSEDDNEPIQEVQQVDDQQFQEEEFPVYSCLEIKRPPLGEFKVVDNDEDDGFKTPTSLDKKIPLSLPCPPAPRKAKSLPSKKRKAHQSEILLDESDEIQSFFSPDYFADLGDKIKKIRKENCKRS